MPRSHWICPVCREPLEHHAGQYRCAQGHCFDQAKEGYVNLLLASHKRSAAPGDDRQMLRSRREFLEQGHYAPLAERLAAHARGEQSARGGRFALLDLGCGEGYYTAGIARALPGAWVGGIDIARDGVRMAARRYPELDLAVASTVRLPVADASLDMVLCVFAPTDDREIRRVLKPGGAYLRVTPGPRHLFELRALIYDAPREHAAATTAIEGMTHTGREALRFPLNLTRAGDAARLLAMTPYYWQATAAQQTSIRERQTLAVQADFCLDLFRADPA